MEVKEKYSFQTDSQIIRSIYQNINNYLIEYSGNVSKKICAIYFSSNNLYYPNSERAFREQLLKFNRFEWYKNRINSASKHIFIRDIQKQWYLSGINSRINTPQKLLDFLKTETEGYQIITLGSSAGGFAAVIYGQLLKAKKIYSFNGQFEIKSILGRSSEETDPLIFRNKDNQILLKWYDSLNFITDPNSIYYFQSIKSWWDIEQYKHIERQALNHIQFITSNHGIPFLSANLPVVINMSSDELQKNQWKSFASDFFFIENSGIIQNNTSLNKRY